MSSSPVPDATLEQIQQSARHSLSTRAEQLQQVPAADLSAVLHKAQSFLPAPAPALDTLFSSLSQEPANCIQALGSVNLSTLQTLIGGLEAYQKALYPAATQASPAGVQKLELLTFGDESEDEAGFSLLELEPEAADTLEPTQEQAVLSCLFQLSTAYYFAHHV